MKATAKDLRFNSKELLETVKRGEEVIITYRGKPCAKIIPYEDSVPAEKSNLFGIWQDKEIGNVDDYVRNIRKGRS